MGYERHLEKLEYIFFVIKCLTNTKLCKTQYYLLFLGSLAINVIDLMWGNVRVFSYCIRSSTQILLHMVLETAKYDSFILCF